MKILLLGEYSGYYTNLAIGFQKLGHDVTLFSNGHGWMQLQGGVPYPRYQGVTGSLKRKLLWKSNLKKFSGYDLVFLISPEFVGESWEPWYWDRIRENNKLIIYTVCGQKDSHVLRLRPFHEKNPFLDKLGEINIEAVTELSRNEFGFFDKVVDECDGIIAVNPDYAACYDEIERRIKCIPLPIDTTQIQPQDATGLKKKFIHGIQHRPFLKGTQTIKEAFNSHESFGEFDFQLVGGLSLSAYIDELCSAHVIVDQCKASSYGMNALYSMALGKVVMSGNEPVWSKRMKIPQPPIINLRNNISQIQSAITKVNNWDSSELRLQSEMSRQYVEDYHDSMKIALQYTEFSKQLM